MTFIRVLKELEVSVERLICDIDNKIGHDRKDWWLYCQNHIEAIRSFIEYSSEDEKIQLEKTVRKLENNIEKITFL